MSTAPEPGRWLTRKAAAAYCGVWVTTIDDWWRAGLISRVPWSRPTHGGYRYDRRQLDQMRAPRPVAEP